MSEQRQRPTAKEESSRVEEVLGSEVIADAERRAQRIRQRGEREAQRIRQRGEKDAQQGAEEILQAARQRAERESNMVLATVEVDAHKVELTAKEEVIEACLQTARRQLLEKDAYDYRAALAELAADAIVQMPGESFMVALGEADAQNRADKLARRIEEVVAARSGRTVHVEIGREHARISGGCVVLSADGRLRYDNSFDARLRRHREHLRRLTARELFSEDEDQP